MHSLNVLRRQNMLGYLALAAHYRWCATQYADRKFIDRAKLHLKWAREDRGFAQRSGWALP